MSECPIQRNPFDTQTLSQPYDFWKALRKEAPVCKVEIPGATSPTYLVTRRADIQEAAWDPTVFSSEVPSDIWRWGNLGPELQPLLDAHGFQIVHTIATADPPAHTYYRSILGTVFTPRLIQAIQPKLQAAIDDRLDHIPLNEPFDLMAAFAIPLPIAMIADLLGLPEQDRPRIQRYTDAFVGMVDPSSDFETASAAVKIFAEGQHFLWEHIERLRAEPADNLLSMIIAARDDQGRSLSREELLSLCYVFMSGGNETTRNAIALAGYYLASNPEIWRLLKQDRAKLGNFVEEVLRLGTPARLNPRVVTQDTMLGGVPLAKGSVIFLMWGSANRDEAAFEFPDEIRLDRPRPRDHQTFGYGIHRCLGAPLGRLELTHSINSWLDRFDSWEFAVPAEQVIESPLFGFHTFPELPIIINRHHI